MNLIKLTQENSISTAEKSAGIIQSGGVILAPFDTVYGFICDPRNTDAIEKIFRLKKRPESKTIGTAVCCFEELEKHVNVNHSEFIKECIPGPYTFILPIKNVILNSFQDPNTTYSGETHPKLSNYCYQNNTLGIRIPDSNLVLDIAKKSGGIVAQTSANKSGLQNCTSIKDILNQFTTAELDQIDLIIDNGVLKTTNPSEIWDLTNKIPTKIER